MKKNREGYLTIELMVALGILVVGLLGIVRLSSESIGLSRVLSGQLIANYLAAEGIEVVKNNIDAGVLGGRQWGYFQGPRVRCYELQYNTTTMPPPFLCAGDYANTAFGTINRLSPLFLNEDTGRYQYGGGRTTPFRRVIRITRNPTEQDQNEIRVDSVVFHDVRGTRFHVHLENRFFNRW